MLKSANNCTYYILLFFIYSFLFDIILISGVEIEPPDRYNMKQAFKDICHNKKLIPEEYFWDKVVQIYDMMVVRHGFMIVGLPLSGE